MVTTNDAMFGEVSVLFIYLFIYSKSDFIRLYPTYSASRVLVSMLIAQHGAAEAVPVGDNGNHGKERQ